MDIHKFVYAVKNIVLTLNNRNYEFLDGVCIYFTLRHDYLKRKLPVIQIGLEADPDIIDQFYRYKDDAKLRVDVLEYEIGEDDHIVNTRLFLRRSFNCIAARDQTSYITTPDQESKDLVDEMRKLQVLELYLIDMEYVNRFTMETSLIVNRCSKASCLQAIFMNRDIPSGVVIATPPMYDEIHENITIPLSDLVKSVGTLNTKYGLYDSRPIVYYDYEYLYCLNLVNPNVTFTRPTEYGTVMFMLLNTTNPEHNVVGSISDPVTKCHYTNLQFEPTILDIEDHDTATQFATILGITSDGSVNKTTLAEHDTKLRYIREFNELSRDQMINEHLPGHIVQINTNSSCASFLKPYKKYMFDVDSQYSDKKLAGYDYRLIGYTLDLQREDPNRYTSMLSITLRAHQRSG